VKISKWAPAWVAVALFVLPLAGCSSKSTEDDKTPVLKGGAPTNLKPAGGGDKPGPKGKAPVTKD
jgi:hypothetical protein